jgi:hypothetical protein
MINFKIIKKGLLITLIVPAIFLFVLLISTFFQKPNIHKLNIVSIKDINSSFNESSSNVVSNTSDDLISFDYKLIGYRAGPVDASVIVKKANKEYVVAIGEKLEGIYELVDVNQNEIIFRNNQKLYKIENLVGK